MKTNPDIEPRWRAHNLPLATLHRLQDADEISHGGDVYTDKVPWHEAVTEALDALDAAQVKLSNTLELSRAVGDRLATQLQTEAQNADRLRTVNMRGRNACNVEIQNAHRISDSDETARELRAACKRVLASLDEDR